jgi:hypothetical protein
VLKCVLNAVHKASGCIARTFDQVGGFEVGKGGAHHGGLNDGLAGGCCETLAFFDTDPIFFDGFVGIPWRVEALAVGLNFFRLDGAVRVGEMLHELARHDEPVAPIDVLECTDVRCYYNNECSTTTRKCRPRPS